MRAPTRVRGLIALLCIHATIAVTVALPVAVGDGANVRAKAPGTTTLQEIDKRIDVALPMWLDFYKTCHANPELSLQEKESAARIAAAFRKAGLAVTENFGGHGVVGVLENGKGPTVLIRGDMDALPIIEDTGVPYASKVKVELGDGSHVGVMHACGHDMHQTVLVATAQMLAGMKEHWHGRAVFVAQPAEEIGRGAAMMIDAGLFEKFGKPDACIALHVSHEILADQSNGFLGDDVSQRITASSTPVRDRSRSNPAANHRGRVR